MTANAPELRASLTRRLQTARATSDSLFAMLSPDAIAARPIPERYRVIFYLGHIEAFDWNLVCRTTMGMNPFNEGFDELFAFGIDPIGGNLPVDRPADWPAIDQIQDYNRRLRHTVDDSLKRTSFTESEDLDQGLVFELAIEHRLMHVETLAYMLHWLPVEDKIRPANGAPALQSRKARPRQIDIPSGTATLGRQENGAFGWDNEFGEVRTQVPAFAIDRYDVTNGQYLAFVRDQGYRDRSLWTPEDWEWKEAAGIHHPRFWEFEGPDSDGWNLRNMFDLRPLPRSWPVYVSHAEASAYARWKGQAVPSEDQLHRAAYGTTHNQEQAYPWGNDLPGSTHGNFAFERWDPAPVGSFPNGDSAFGVADLLGNGWEWTSTIFEPLPGFKRYPFYPGYSADFFDGQHYVMKGGSSRTAASMLRRSFRNWFRPHYPHIYSAFRLVTK